MVMMINDGKIENAMKMMHEQSIKLCNERGTRIMQLELLLEKLRFECGARGLYSMKDMIEEVL